MTCADGDLKDFGQGGHVETPAARVRSYFVDESGDGLLFGRTGRVLFRDGSSPRNFVLGLADVEDAEGLTLALEDLRAALLADSYFRNVPSMQAAAGKTAVFFHAKDDIPEVRRQVFALLLEHDVRFLAGVRSMESVLAYVRTRNETDAFYRYHPNELYDHMVRRLLKTKLHKEDRYRIVFARRGNSDRAKALEEAINVAQSRFRREHGLDVVAEVQVHSGLPKDHGGLQAADYFLWALQRLYERGEERYITYLWPRVSLVHDIDDTRQASYGVYYTKEKPLSAASIKERLRI
jgi:hypothetical protein